MMELSEKLLNGTITPEERKRLFEWYDGFEDGELVLDPGQARVFQQMKEGMLEEVRREMPTAALRRLSWRRVAVAAAVLVLVAGAGYFFMKDGRAGVAVAAAGPGVTRAAMDILPGGEKAVLELGDGSKVVLDSVGSGRIGRQGNVEVMKNGVGGLRYAAGDAVAAADGSAAGGLAAAVYNRLTTPKGGRYELELQDGTKVWLNAGSSIRYPSAFTGAERRVEIRGEAYFQVARDARRPFRVAVEEASGGSSEIEVLGTEFNVNAYADEPDARTTLVNGGVRVRSGSWDVVLSPMQQAVASAKGLREQEVADLAQVVAWRSGFFSFEDGDLSEILRQIARWYDVEVVYKGKIPGDRFTGRFPRSTSLAGVLKILNISGVRLEAENKKIVVISS
jgi:transmembrane sensor